MPTSISQNDDTPEIPIVNKTHHDTNVDNLKCLYTNADCLTNKMDLLESYVSIHDTDIVAIVETLQKKTL